MAAHSSLVSCPPRRDALDLLAGVFGPVAKVAESLGDLLVGGGEQMTPRQAERAAIREAERKEARAESEMVARLEKSLRATEAEIDRRGGNVSGEHLAMNSAARSRTPSAIQLRMIGTARAIRASATTTSGTGNGEHGNAEPPSRRDPKGGRAAGHLPERTGNSAGAVW